MKRCKLLRTVELPMSFPPDYYASVINLMKLLFNAPLGIARAIHFCRTYAHDANLTDFYRIILTVGATLLAPLAVLMTIWDGIVLAIRGRLIAVTFVDCFITT